MRTVAWVCTRSRCSAKASTSINYTNDLSSFTLLIGHSHQVSPDKILRKELIQKMKPLMETGIVFPREAINIVMRGASDEKIRALGNAQNVLRILRRHAKNTINPRPYLYVELELSAVLCNTHLGTTFYQYGPGIIGLWKSVAT